MGINVGERNFATCCSSLMCHIHGRDNSLGVSSLVKSTSVSTCSVSLAAASTNSNNPSTQSPSFPNSRVRPFQHSPTDDIIPAKAMKTSVGARSHLIPGLHSQDTDAGNGTTANSLILNNSHHHSSVSSLSDAGVAVFDVDAPTPTYSQMLLAAETDSPVNTVPLSNTSIATSITNTNTNTNTNSTGLTTAPLPSRILVPTSTSPFLPDIDHDAETESDEEIPIQENAPWNSTNIPDGDFPESVEYTEEAFSQGSDSPLPSTAPPVVRSVVPPVGQQVLPTVQQSLPRDSNLYRRSVVASAEDDNLYDSTDAESEDELVILSDNNDGSVPVNPDENVDNVDRNIYNSSHSNSNDLYNELPDTAPSTNSLLSLPTTNPGILDPGFYNSGAVLPTSLPLGITSSLPTIPTSTEHTTGAEEITGGKWAAHPTSSSLGVSRIGGGGGAGGEEDIEGDGHVDWQRVSLERDVEDVADRALACLIRARHDAAAGNDSASGGGAGMGGGLTPTSAVTMLAAAATDVAAGAAATATAADTAAAGGGTGTAAAFTPDARALALMRAASLHPSIFAIDGVLPPAMVETVRDNTLPQLEYLLAKPLHRWVRCRRLADNDVRRIKAVRAALHERERRIMYDVYRWRELVGRDIEALKALVRARRRDERNASREVANAAEGDAKAGGGAGQSHGPGYGDRDGLGPNDEDSEDDNLSPPDDNSDGDNQNAEITIEELEHEFLVSLAQNTNDVKQIEYLHRLRDLAARYRNLPPGNPANFREAQIPEDISRNQALSQIFSESLANEEIARDNLLNFEDSRRRQVSFAEEAMEVVIRIVNERLCNIDEKVIREAAEAFLQAESQQRTAYFTDLLEDCLNEDRIEKGLKKIQILWNVGVKTVPAPADAGVTYKDPLNMRVQSTAHGAQTWDQLTMRNEQLTKSRFNVRLHSQKKSMTVILPRKSVFDPNHVLQPVHHTPMPTDASNIKTDAAGARAGPGPGTKADAAARDVDGVWVPLDVLIVHEVNTIGLFFSLPPSLVDQGVQVSFTLHYTVLPLDNYGHCIYDNETHGTEPHNVGLDGALGAPIGGGYHALTRELSVAQVNAIHEQQQQPQRDTASTSPPGAVPQQVSAPLVAAEEARLRAALGTPPDAPLYITGVEGPGITPYRFDITTSPTYPPPQVASIPLSYSRSITSLSQHTTYTLPVSIKGREDCGSWIRDALARCLSQGFSDISSYRVVCFIEDSWMQFRSLARTLDTSSRNIGLRGLENQGATCYMNSYLQVLFHLPLFRRALYAIPTEGRTDVYQVLKYLHMRRCARAKAEARAGVGAEATVEAGNGLQGEGQATTTSVSSHPPCPLCRALPILARADKRRLTLRQAVARVLALEKEHAGSSSSSGSGVGEVATSSSSASSGAANITTTSVPDTASTSTATSTSTADTTPTPDASRMSSRGDLRPARGLQRLFTAMEGDEDHLPGTSATIYHQQVSRARTLAQRLQTGKPVESLEGEVRALLAFDEDAAMEREGVGAAGDDTIPQHASNQVMDCKQASLLDVTALMSSNTLDHRSIDTTDLTVAFGWGNSAVLEQQDVQEFSSLLLDAVEKAAVNTPAEECVSRLFIGEEEHYTKCVNVNYESARSQPFNCLQISIKGHPSLHHALKAHLLPERLEGDNQYRAEQYGKQDADRGLRLKSLPPYLQVALGRFEMDYNTMSMRKVNSVCAYPETIDMTQYLHDGGNRSSGGVQTDSAADENPTSTTDIGVGASTSTSTSPLAQALTQATQDLHTHTTDLTRYTHAKVSPAGPCCRVHGRLDNIYDLYGVVVHAGHFEGGHYYTYVKPPLPSMPKEGVCGDACTAEKCVEGCPCAGGDTAYAEAQWFKFNDETVTLADREEVFKRSFGDNGHRGMGMSAYMLVYMRRSLTRHHPDAHAQFPLHPAALALGERVWENARIRDDNGNAIRVKEEDEKQGDDVSMSGSTASATVSTTDSATAFAADTPLEAQLVDALPPCLLSMPSAPSITLTHQPAPTPWSLLPLPPPFPATKLELLKSLLFSLASAPSAVVRPLEVRRPVSIRAGRLREDVTALANARAVWLRERQSLVMILADLEKRREEQRRKEEEWSAPGPGLGSGVPSDVSLLSYPHGTQPHSTYSAAQPLMPSTSATAAAHPNANTNTHANANTNAAVGTAPTAALVAAAQVAPSAHTPHTAQAAHTASVIPLTQASPAVHTAQTAAYPTLYTSRDAHAEVGAGARIDAGADKRAGVYLDGHFADGKSDRDVPDAAQRHTHGGVAEQHHTGGLQPTLTPSTNTAATGTDVNAAGTGASGSMVDEEAVAAVENEVSRLHLNK